MIGLFCFDGPLYKDINGIYCNVTLTNEMFSRYFSIVNRLIIVVRTFNVDKTYKEMNMKPLCLENIEIIEVKNFNTIKGFIIEKYLFEKNIENTIKNIDCIFARMPSNTSNSVLKIANRLKKSYLVEVGGCAWDSFWNHGILGKIVAPIMYYREKKYVKNADFAIYVTENFLQSRYPNKSVVANCSNVYLIEVDNMILKQRLKKIERTNLSKIVIGQAVNSIDVKYKGEHLIIKAISELKDMGIIIEYEVVGPGNGIYLMEQARRFGVERQLKLIGTLKKEEMFNWYKRIDIYVQPSLQEGLPRSLIEAMSMGCPCIGSNIAGIPELIDKNSLFNPKKNKEIISCIIKMLDINVLKKQSYDNFETAKKYELAVIEYRRNNIFQEYKNSIIGRGELINE